MNLTLSHRLLAVFLYVGFDCPGAERGAEGEGD